MVFCALVDLTNSSAGNLEYSSFATNTCLESAIGPLKSTATDSHGPLGMSDILISTLLGDFVLARQRLHPDSVCSVRVSGNQMELSNSLFVQLLDDFRVRC